MELNQTNSRILRNGVKAFDLIEKKDNDLFENLELKRDKILYKSINQDKINKGQKIKGEGEATAIKTYAEAYEKDIKFYELIRTLESYEKFIDGKTTVVLSADSELLKFINTSDPDGVQFSESLKSAVAHND